MPRVQPQLKLKLPLSQTRAGSLKVSILRFKKRQLKLSKSFSKIRLHLQSKLARLALHLAPKSTRANHNKQVRQQQKLPNRPKLSPHHHRLPLLPLLSHKPPLKHLAQILRLQINWFTLVQARQLNKLAAQLPQLPLLLPRTKFDRWANSLPRSASSCVLRDSAAVEPKPKWLGVSFKEVPLRPSRHLSLSKNRSAKRWKELKGLALSLKRSKNRESSSARSDLVSRQRSP